MPLLPVPAAYDPELSRSQVGIGSDQASPRETGRESGRAGSGTGSEPGRAPAPESGLAFTTPIVPADTWRRVIGDELEDGTGSGPQGGNDDGDDG
jgi:hypothetical protein